MQQRKIAVWLVVASAALSLTGIGNRSHAGPPAETRRYDVPFADAAPVIDSVLSAGEWDASGTEAGDWRLLRTPMDPDANNTRARALWTDEALYILVISSQASWRQATNNDEVCLTLDCSIDFIFDEWNLYFDPNTDGEPNATAPDGYQIGFNTFEGQSSFGVDPLFFVPEPARLVNSGFFGEAHIDMPFGNAGAWGPLSGAFDWSFISRVGAWGGLIEIRLPWTTFGASMSHPTDTGLYHPFAPVDGDVWFVNMAHTSSVSGSQLPVWNWTPSQFFADRPHGEFRFVFFADGFENGNTSAWSAAVP